VSTPSRPLAGRISGPPLEVWVFRATTPPSRRDAQPAD
jgi:hypothetical protein